ncbi:MAG: hypothetical protein KY468_00800 [Armatimonadetes bacterium]|nr:hypothetical protein [Armatimonadota bacterium]
MAEQWHRCRECGEEGLSAQEEICPCCGLEEPVQLCHRCSLPIRGEEPWRIIARSNDSVDTAPRRFSYHGTCYPSGKRQLHRERYRSPNWRITTDRRDTSEPLSRQRMLLGWSLLLIGAGLVLWLIAASPRPEPIFAPLEWDRMAQRDVNFHWARHWMHHRPRPASFAQILFIMAGIGMGLWLIRWGLSRPRALFLDGLFDRDDRNGEGDRRPG